MKVGVYLGRQPPDVGGGYTFQDEIFRSFVKQAASSKHSYCVICGMDAVRYHRDLAAGARNVEVVGLPDPTVMDRVKTRLRIASPLVREHLKAPDSLGRVAAGQGVDIMWCVSAGPVLLDIPFITVVWDLQHRLQPWFPEVSSAGQWDLRESSYSLTLRRATVVIAGTAVGREEIHGFYQVPRERIRLLPHPTPDFALSHAGGPEPTADIRRKYGIAGDYLFYPAQLWPHKNHVNLLHAICDLKNRRGIRIEAVFSGSNKGNRRHIDRLARALELQDAVHFLGFVPQDDLVLLYRHAVALTYLSYFGPENLPPLEAFALGCPVIAARVPGSEEQLGDAALHVDPNDPTAIAAAIESTYRDDALRGRLIRAGRSRAERWQCADFVKGIFGILDEFERVRRCWE